MQRSDEVAEALAKLGRDLQSSDPHTKLEALVRMTALAQDREKRAGLDSTISQNYLTQATAIAKQENAKRELAAQPATTTAATTTQPAAEQNKTVSKKTAAKS